MPNFCQAYIILGLTHTLGILLYVRAACRRQTLRAGGADAPEGGVPPAR
ncbi:hypothetical protein GS682_18430 [Nostoc sp. B(2019)]|nr:hypothetical protein [Nostoc sp. B(2019)]